MSLLNLTLGQLLSVLAPVAAVVVALYLYDRTRRRQIVSTLRFFREMSRAPVFTRRKKIHQPWSLLMQLVCVALLLLAIAGPECCGRADAGRDHVLILETSAWMNSSGPASSSGNRLPLMAAARRGALDYLRALAPQDRVLLVRADALATPVTPFTRNRPEIEQAIRASRPGATALNLHAALEVARSAQKLASGRPGEIVLVGSGRAAPRDLERAAGTDLAGVRAILVGGDPANCGIRKLAARRLATDPLLWEIEVGAHNYGDKERRVSVSAQMGGARAGSRSIVLPPRSSGAVSFQVRAAEAATLEAVMQPNDGYGADNRATLELPALRPLAVEVFTERPDLWTPLLTASRFLTPQFRRPGDYTPSGAPGRLVILDGFAPATMPAADLVWIRPEGARPQQNLHIRRWNAGHAIAEGLRDRDLPVQRASLVAAGPGDTVIAATQQGPVLVVSDEGQHKKVIFGFHPLAGGLQNHLAIPLLFANLARWVSPDLFRLAEVSANPPGMIEAEVPAGTRPEEVRVSTGPNRDLPFTLVDNRLRFFVGYTATARVALPGRELAYTLHLPEVGEVRWEPPAGVRKGIPPASSIPLPADLWPWLAAAGALGLLAEWMWYGRRPIAAPAVPQQAAVPPSIVPRDIHGPAVVPEVRS